MVSSTVVVLVGGVMKPAVDVQVKGGFNVSETLPFLLCRDWRISKSNKSEFRKTVSLTED